MEFVGKDISALRTGLLDMTQPIAKRTHAAFILRTMGTEEAADILCEGKEAVVAFGFLHDMFAF